MMNTTKIAEVLSQNKNVALRAIIGMYAKESTIIDTELMLAQVRDYVNDVIPESPTGQTVGKLVSEIENQISRGRNYTKLYRASEDPTVLAYSRNPFAGILYGEGSLTQALGAYRKAVLEIGALNSAISALGGEKFLRKYVPTKLNDDTTAETAAFFVSEWVVLCDQFDSVESTVEYEF